MRECIYCRKNKEDNKFSLEHIVPKFLGGAYVPDNLKTRDVCTECNNTLGTFVDASVAKTSLVLKLLTTSNYILFNPNKNTSLPLIYQGHVDFHPPEIRKNETCEVWLGPLGELVFNIRPEEDRTYWYSGGNPIKIKNVETRAYFMFRERSNKNQLLSLLSFGDAFKGKKKVKKIMCTVVEGDDLKKYGFSDPDILDIKRIKYFNKNFSNKPILKSNFPMNMDFDHRFLAKIGIGFAYVYFGKKILDTEYMSELLKALYPKEGNAEPKIFRSGAMDDGDDLFKLACGLEYAVTISILPGKEGILINLNINTELNSTIICASYDDLNQQDLDAIGIGICIVLVKPLKLCVTLTIPELVAHKSGNKIHPKLGEISNQIDQYKDYFKNL
ncbi:MAG: hypothetical protein ACI86H_002243 [bacterium]|jgi:hypothetical protein